MKTQLVTLSSLFFISLSSSVLASDAIVNESLEQKKQDEKSYHSQDIRNVQSSITGEYESYEDADAISLDGTYGINDKASVGITYKNYSFDYDDEASDVMSLTGQYNISSNVVIDGVWNNIDGEYNNYRFGGNYVGDARFGVWNVGANYYGGDLADGFDVEAGVLVPFGNMYYRGDFTYFVDAEGYENIFENKLGWTNGKIDVNASVSTYELGEDTFFGVELGYLF
ncbi:hypothetical protein [Vibrio splendidus]|uniref:hypothetical protein n=1 Tax=Vibrio splendidus TaxID=29497 RepID=UPI000769E14E|nr:hypothetical protein [Vibrio splendidus]PHX06166.1 hypothetical protein VSPL_20750 [Vibrio splendidus]